jgi:trans-L-3-hydroxyproline dehydratase
MHNEGWSTMCGHGVIALVTVLLESGMLSPRDVVRLDAPAGRIVARPRREGDRVRAVAFENVPSFVVALDETVAVPGLGRVRYDLAFGGAFYSFVEASAVGLDLDAAHFRALIDAGTAIKRAVAAARPVTHPFEPELGFLYGTIFTGPAESAAADSRNVCIFAEGEVDRSPTGTGVSGRVAIERARGRLAPGATFAVESIIGTRFVGRTVRAVRWEGQDAVVPEIEGSAWISGRGELLFAPDDPLPEGFILR